MDEDARLTDFGGDEPAASEETTTDGDASADETPSDEATTDETTTNLADDRDGIDATYQWDPAGRECADCGAVVEVRWRDEAGMVCPDCKDW